MTPENAFSRGGPKPEMFGPHGKDLPLLVGGRQKAGLYQLDPRGAVLGRLVELPTWLSNEAELLRGTNRTLLDALKSGDVCSPKTVIGESKGHILIDAAKYSSIGGPAVGVDLPILKPLLPQPPRQVRFFVYYIGYRRAEVWQVPWLDFMAKSEIVTADPPFMPQRMISVQHLVRFA